MKKKPIIAIILVLLAFNMNAQEQPLTIEQALSLSIENNAGLKAEKLKVDKANTLIGSAFNFDKTNVYYNYDESNLATNNKPLKVFGVSQYFKFPTIYFANKKVNEAKYNIESSSYDIKVQQLKREVYTNFYQLNYAQNKAETYQYLDSLYQDFAKKAERRFELGETNYLEMITAKSKQKQLETLYKQAQQDVVFRTEQLKKVVQVDTISIMSQPLEKLNLQSISIDNNVGLLFFESSKNYFKAVTKKEKQNLLPDLSAEYFQGSNSGLNETIRGYQFGVKIPLLFSGQRSKIKASKIAEDLVVEKQLDYKTKLMAEHQSLLAKLQQYDDAINYYETQGKLLSEEIIKTANRTYKEGEIDFFQYIQSLETAKEIQLNYLEQLNAYNQTIIAINHLIL